MLTNTEVHYAEYFDLVKYKKIHKGLPNGLSVVTKQKLVKFLEEVLVIAKKASDDTCFGLDYLEGGVSIIEYPSKEEIIKHKEKAKQVKEKYLKDEGFKQYLKDVKKYEEMYMKYINIDVF